MAQYETPVLIDVFGDFRCNARLERILDGEKVTIDCPSFGDIRDLQRWIEVNQKYVRFYGEGE